MTNFKSLKTHIKEFYKSDQILKRFIFKEIHPDLKNEKDIVLGIDEAGRGPVLGPMVYSCCFTTLQNHEVIRDYECVDSKALKDDDRRRILKKIEKCCFIDEKDNDSDIDDKEEKETTKEDTVQEERESNKKENETDKDANKKSSLKSKKKSTKIEIDPANPLKLGYITKILTPTFLSVNQLAPIKYNLNEISHDCATDLIQEALNENVNVKYVYVDTVGPPESYQRKLEQRFPNITFTVEKKADAIYPSVSAASIIAKVSRDHLVESWKHPEPIASNSTYEKFASGYPGDAKTINWLNDNFDTVFGYPQFVRFDWSTAKKRINENGVPLEWFEEEDDNVKSGQKRRSTGNQLKIGQKKRPFFYYKMNLEKVKSDEVIF